MSLVYSGFNNMHYVHGIHYAGRPLDGDSPGLRTASCATKVCAYRSQRYTQMRGIIVAAIGAAGEI